jgi:hypothetical protein
MDATLIQTEKTRALSSSVPFPFFPKRDKVRLRQTRQIEFAIGCGVTREFKMQP